MVQGETEPDGSAVVEDVDREFLQTDLLREFPDDLGQMVKCIGEAFVIRRVGEAEAGQIRRNHVILLGQFRNQVAEQIVRNLFLSANTRHRLCQHTRGFPRTFGGPPALMV